MWSLFCPPGELWVRLYVAWCQKSDVKCVVSIPRAVSGFPVFPGGVSWTTDDHLDPEGQRGRVAVIFGTTFQKLSAFLWKVLFSSGCLLALKTYRRK